MSDNVEMNSQPSSANPSNSGIALVIGASGGIGSAICSRLLSERSFCRIVGVSRNPDPPGFSAEGSTPVTWIHSDYSEESIAKVCAEIAALGRPLSRVFIATGTLHGEDYFPEKRIESLDGEAMQTLFQINTILPAIWLKAMTSLFSKDSRCVITTLSARIGSIDDNRSGGWYSYRASKAALNMILKTASIEYARRFPGIRLIAFHPGTTDTELSKPFQPSVPPEKLFSAKYVAECLMEVIDASADGENIRFLDWAGKDIVW